MSGAIALPRELGEQILSELTSGAVSVGTGAKLRALLVAPVVERQPVVHSMKSVAEAVDASRCYTVLTSDQCFSLAQSLNNQALRVASPELAALHAAARTLKARGYTYNGGEHWRPPLGQKPNFKLLDSLHAELARYQEGHTNLVKRAEAAEQRNRELVAGIVALPLEFKELSGCENTAGVYACIDHISEWVAEVAKPATALDPKLIGIVPMPPMEYDEP
jgi:hypothetical protein